MNRMVREPDGQFRVINAHGQVAVQPYRGWEIRFHRQVSTREINGVPVRATAGVYIGHVSLRGLDFDTMTYPTATQVRKAIDTWWTEMGHRYGWREGDVERGVSIFK